jgi:nucleoside-diphosphate-sugar epimerase
MVTHRDETTSAERVAIVTGGSHGIGREIARRLARHGHPVVVVYRRQQRRAETAVEEILATEGTALTVRADVADEFDVERLFSETTAAFGGVDVVVHTTTDNAALLYQHAARHVRPSGAIVCTSAAERLPPAIARQFRERDITVGSAPPEAVLSFLGRWRRPIG